MAALSDAWWPLEVTRAAYPSAVRVLPATWAMPGFTNVVVRGLGVNAVLPERQKARVPVLSAKAALLGFAVLFFVAVARRFRFE